MAASLPYLLSESEEEPCKRVKPIPTPLKRKIAKATNVYNQTCKTLDRVIAEAFGFECPEQDSPEQRVIKHVHNRALLAEAARLLPDGGEALRRDRRFADEMFGELAALDDPLPPAEAEKRFLEAYQELAGYALRRS